jgi:thiol:disulfide interchange protein
MWKKAIVLYLILFLPVGVVSAAAPTGTIKTDIVTISVEKQHDAVRPNSKSALAVHFQLAEGWYFYASQKTAPGSANLKLRPFAGKLISFSAPIFPKPQLYFDKSWGRKLEVFGNSFTVYLPFMVADKTSFAKENIEPVKITIEGAICSGFQCRMPDFGQLSTDVKIVSDATMSEPRFTVLQAEQQNKLVLPVGQAGYSILFAFGLAFLAGLSLNIMPCVWPVLPIIVLRLVEQAPQGQVKHGRGKSVIMGLLFCLGILLFFAALAGASIILQLFYGTVLQWGDQFRSPIFVTAMALLLVVLALFMFDVFTITVPSAVAAKGGPEKGFAGAFGMGFLAAVLSTPCSFAILAAAFAWAQAQPLPLGTFTIMVIGLGMAAPYAVLTSLPGLLAGLPKPGRWMQIFKQTVGFILLFIALWLILALPQQRRAGVLYFALVIGFCAWMWAGWVDYSTKFSRKLVIRIIAVALAVAAGLYLLAPPVKLIDWQQYDAGLIKTAIEHQRPVLIEFTADWCISCRFVDKMVYSRSDIAELIRQKSILAVRADTTVRDNPATLALRDIYNEPGVPVTILFLPGKKEPVRWHSKAFADELKKLLQNIDGGSRIGKTEPGA